MAGERIRTFYGNEVNTSGLSGVTEHLTMRTVSLQGIPEIIQLAKTTYFREVDGIVEKLIGWRPYTPFAD
jgi:hypothetical protein